MKGGGTCQEYLSLYSGDMHKVIGWALGLLVTTLLSVGWQWPDGKLRVIGCDTGQGDATLITLGFDQVLIDTGPANGKVLACLNRHVPFWDKKIELLVVSHPQADHIGSAKQVLDHYQAGMILAPNAAVDSETFWRFYQATWGSGARLLTSTRAERLALGAMHFEVLWPEAIESGASIWGTESSESSLDAMADNEERDVNDVSTVVLLRYGEFRALFLGDLESEAELALLALGDLEAVDLVKVGHHGSDTSSSQPLVDRLVPQIALIEVGKGNRYGHPSEEVIKRWQESGAEVWRTDEKGEVVIIGSADGNVLVRAQ